MQNKIYIKFNDPKPKSLPPKDGLIKKYSKVFIMKFLSIILPKANPDFDDLIEEVEVWKIEYDTEEDCAWREIGFNINGKTILIMPFNNNYGYWTDNNLSLDDYNKFNPIQISQNEFENDWNNFAKQYKTISW